MKSENTGRIEDDIQPGDYFLRFDGQWIRRVKSVEIRYVRCISKALTHLYIDPNIEIHPSKLGTKLTKRKAMKMLKLAGYET